MGLLISFLKIFCVPIFVVVGFLSVGSYNFENRKKAKETILNGLTCMFVPCLIRHSGSGEITLGLALTYYVIFNFGYGLMSRACMLQMIPVPFGDPPVFLCHPTDKVCKNSTNFIAPKNLTDENFNNCSVDFFSFEKAKENYVTYCTDGYLDGYYDVALYVISTISAVLCLFLSLRLAMLGKISKASSITHLGGRKIF